MCTLFRFRQMMVQQMLLDAYEHRHSLQEAEAFMLHGHGHAANNVPLLQSKCPNIQIRPQPSSLFDSSCRPLGVPPCDSPALTSCARATCRCSSTCRAAGAGGHTALVPERRGDGLPRRRRGGSHSTSQQQLRLPVDWPSVPHAGLTSALDGKDLKTMNK